MSNRSWTEILILLRKFEPERYGRGHPVLYPEYLLAWLSLWAAFHLLPLSELALQLEREGWPRVIRRSIPRKLRRRRPDASTLSRRWRSELFFKLMDWVLDRLACPDRTGILDGTLLPVGYHSKDPEARFGGPASHFQQGYKAVRLANPYGQAWAVEVDSADRNEVGVAPRLLDRAKEHELHLSRVLGDSIFDSEPLRARCHMNLDALLVAPSYRRGRGTAGGSRQPRTGPLRRAAQKLLRSPWGKHWQKLRESIERSHGWLKQRPHYLYALPPFIRGKRRVRRWVVSHEILLSFRKALRLANTVA